MEVSKAKETDGQDRTGQDRKKIEGCAHIRLYSFPCILSLEGIMSDSSFYVPSCL